MKVIEMNVSLMNTSKYFFNYSVVYYFCYAYFCGKPNPLMMRTGLRLLNCHSADGVMVGDRMDTDVISGLESGMSTVLVLSGVTSEAEIRTYAYKPTVVLNGVGDIVKMAVSSKKNKE